MTGEIYRLLFYYKRNLLRIKKTQTEAITRVCYKDFFKSMIEECNML